MTPRELVEQWRKRARTRCVGAYQIAKCADELAALLPPAWNDETDRWRMIPHAKEEKR